MRVVAMLHTEDQNGPNSQIIEVPKDGPFSAVVQNGQSILCHGSNSCAPPSVPSSQRITFLPNRCGW